MLRREIKGRYSQTFLGLGWALIQPVVMMIAFTVIFTKVAHVPTDGVPYPIFSYAALIPWSFFASAVGAGTFSIVAYRSLVTRIYFPRIVLPIAEVASRLLDFVVAASLFVVLMMIYRVAPSWWMLLVPLLLLIQLVLAIGVVLWTSALFAFYRDVGAIVQLGLQLWLLLSPVAYPLSAVAERQRPLFLLNPLAGLIEAYRSVLVFGRAPEVFPLLVSVALTLVILVGGYFFFRMLNPYFADAV
jgi:lipopolysaccharide transport system permease protein